MADIINIRLTKDCPEVSLMDTQAKALGISRNDLARLQGTRLVTAIETE